MKLIKDTEFGGERPLFASHDLHLDNVIIRAGESAIKECSNIKATNCRFEGNYPFWHVHGFVIENCFFDVGGRSALWYSDHLLMKNTRIDAPKMFREMNDINIENVEINDADEIFWRCNGIHIKNLHLHDGTVHAEIKGSITNIKNPKSGFITADEIGSITIDNNIKAPADCKIHIRNERSCDNNQNN